MPVFRLSTELAFPPPELSEPEGLLAVGGDLSVPRLLLAYSMGIFPWFSPGDPLLWWSPDPRCIFAPGDLRRSRSLRRRLRRGDWRVTFDHAFDTVIQECAAVRRESGIETWLTQEMIAAYQELHRRGYAHSAECWQEGELAGGIYGVCLGRCFFGESMFHRRKDASKVALAVLAESLFAAGFGLIDCQLSNAHLQSLGATLVGRAEFLRRLRRHGVRPSAVPPPGAFPSAPGHSPETTTAP